MPLYRSLSRRGGDITPRALQYAYCIATHIGMTSSFLPGLKNLRSAMTHPSIQTGIVRFSEKSTPVTFFAIRCASFGVSCWPATNKLGGVGFESIDTAAVNSAVLFQAVNSTTVSGDPK